MAGFVRLGIWGAPLYAHTYRLVLKSVRAKGFDADTGQLVIMFF